MEWADFPLYLRRLSVLILIATSALLTACDCDDCKQEKKQVESDLEICEEKRDDFEEQKNVCNEELTLIKRGELLSVSCSVTSDLSIDAAKAQLTVTCNGETSVTVTELSVVAPDGMAIKLPDTNAQPGGGGVVFPGGGGVVFPGGGGVVFPGGGGVVFAPDGEASDPTDVTEDIMAYDVYKDGTSGPSDTIDGNGFLKLPGANTRFRCEQSEAQDTLQLFELDHIINSGHYTISCNKLSTTDSVKGILVTSM